MKRLTLELGGKSPLIVFNDGNIEKAAFLANMFGTLSSG
jgi:acyl-CoA reductase-like NAD-dependent aldehyde dehydrogenase